VLVYRWHKTDCQTSQMTVTERTAKFWKTKNNFGTLSCRFGSEFPDPAQTGRKCSAFFQSNRVRSSEPSYQPERKPTRRNSKFASNARQHNHETRSSLYRKRLSFSRADTVKWFLTTGKYLQPSSTLLTVVAKSLETLQVCVINNIIWTTLRYKLYLPKQ